MLGSLWMSHVTPCMVIGGPEESAAILVVGFQSRHSAGTPRVLKGPMLEKQSNPLRGIDVFIVPDYNYSL